LIWFIIPSPSWCLTEPEGLPHNFIQAFVLIGLGDKMTKKIEIVVIVHSNQPHSWRKKKNVLIHFLVVWFDYEYKTRSVWFTKTKGK